MSVLPINVFSASLLSVLAGKKSLNKAKFQLATIFLQPIRQWLDSFEIQNPQVAKFIAKSIPTQCPLRNDARTLSADRRRHHPHNWHG